MKNFIYLLLLIQTINCTAQNYPPKHSDLSERLYNDYCSRLKDADAKKDFYQEALALANLKQSPEQVFELLHKSIKQHDTICYKIHEYEDMNKNYGFQIVLVKADSIRWKKLCAECEKIVPLEDYFIKKQREELAYKQKKAMLESKLDTNLLDKKLIALLEDIIEKDQRIISLKNPMEKEARNKERLYLDSLNLIEIDAIFKKEGGYPSLQKVGYEQIMTPWFVLQHQSSPIVRRKYMHYIEEAVGKGYINKNNLDNYKERTLNHEEAEQSKLKKSAH
jgi:hypothetical protein